MTIEPPPQGNGKAILALAESAWTKRALSLALVIAGAAASMVLNDLRATVKATASDDRAGREELWKAQSETAKALNATVLQLNVLTEKVANDRTMFDRETGRLSSNVEELRRRLDGWPATGRP